MTLADALRFLDHEAKECRDRDAHEALCLLLPSMLRVFDLAPMTDVEARIFRLQLRDVLKSDFRFDAQPSTVGRGGPT